MSWHQAKYIPLFLQDVMYLFLDRVFVAYSQEKDYNFLFPFLNNTKEATWPNKS